MAGTVVAHWSFAGPVGPKLADKTGRHPGAAEGVSEAPGGGAWHFPGDSANVRVTTDSSLDLVNGFTIEATVRLDRLGNKRNDLGVQAIVEKHIAPGGYLLIVTREGNLAYWLEAPDGRTTDTSTVAIKPGAWHHVALTWDKHKTTFWVDGKPAGSKAFTGPLGRCPQDVYLGNDDTKNWSWNGDIADIRISDVALTPAQFERMKK